MTKICIQGIKGSYSFEASQSIQKKIKTNFETEFCKSFEDTFDKIKKHKLGVLPVENTTAGSVLGVIDLIKENDCKILLEFNLKINHCLLANKKSKKVEKVYSHYQALSQCSDFLNKKKLKQNVFSDTASSAKYVSEKNDLTAGCISSELCSKIFNLKIVQKNIQNLKNNQTRFFLIKKKNSKFEFEKNLKKNKITIYFETKHIPSALYKALGGFATNNINLTKLESRPCSKNPFKYSFYIDFLGKVEDINIKNSLDELKFFSNKIQILGEYEKFI